MGLFDRLERALEALIEGRFPGRFGGRVHPLEIARRLSREMLSAARVGLRRRYVPNMFGVRLHPQDAAALKPLENSVLAEIREFLEEEVRERDLSLPGPLEVSLGEDTSVAEGSFEVDVSFREAPGFEPVPLPAPPEPEQASVPPPPQPSQGPPHPRPQTDRAACLPPSPRARLVGRAGFALGLLFDLVGAQMRVGRLADSDLQVPDAEVSRHHAILRRHQETWTVEDAGSRHGTRVNGKVVSGSRPLQHGDDIEVGASVLRFEIVED